ncbi:hypothetical protein MY3296_005122 [Beauveria thailandica]
MAANHEAIFKCNPTKNNNTDEVESHFVSQGCTIFISRVIPRCGGSRDIKDSASTVKEF